MSLPLLDYDLALAGWPKPRSSLLKGGGNPMLADTGVDRCRINWAAGHGHRQVRAGLGNALDGGDIGRDEPLLVFSCCVASSVSCSACSSCSAPNAGSKAPCAAAHAYASKWERSIAADEWMAGPASASELHGSHPGLYTESSEIRVGRLSRIYWVRSLVRGSPRKGLD